MSSSDHAGKPQRLIDEALATLMRELPQHHILILACPVGAKAGNAAFTNPKEAVLALAEQFMKAHIRRHAN
ncbi:MAG TPA: hypothetical protein VG758_20815 [Hyphomicrobiaceae bacterium]|jgi:hypothetical protein|nr:hypothetical protein [Hyphomicrobiaceae bacterium]